MPAQPAATFLVTRILRKARPISPANMPSVSQAEMAGRLILSIALLGMSSPAVGFLPMTGNPSTLRRPQAAITCEPSLRVSRGASSVRMVTTNEKDGTVVEDALARYEIFAKLESQEEAASVDMANMKHE